MGFSSSDHQVPRTGARVLLPGVTLTLGMAATSTSQPQAVPEGYAKFPQPEITQEPTQPHAWRLEHAMAWSAGVCARHSPK